MTVRALSDPIRFKLDMLFDGIRYSEALGAAAEHAFPNFYPYRFADGEANPTGRKSVTIPYLLTSEDGTLARIKGNAHSPWVVSGSAASGYLLRHDEAPDQAIPIQFEPLPRWMGENTSDGFPMARAGVSLHGDMAVVNVAPGCDYFLHKVDGKSMRCGFCAYGAPDERVAHLGQQPGKTALPRLTVQHLQEALQAALAESPIRHIYLVGGSLTDWAEEGKRFIELAREVQAVNPDRIPVCCGSGALPSDALAVLHAEGLAQSVCFNLEVWSEGLFSKVCPGKHQYVGYHRWIEALEAAVSLWGRGKVYSAMVAGIELEPEHELDWEAAAALALQGAEDLCSRGIIPIYSLYWPVGGRDHPQYLGRLRSYFERVVSGYAEIRRRHGLRVSDAFMCHRCAFMQLECDMDRLAPQQA
ncbi:MAG: hypothetical protein KDG52_01730 [Rhodocyclaceae bacterium]|nr:hypothetical protein [Rhodocyclaceae bacterium]